MVGKDETGHSPDLESQDTGSRAYLVVDASDDAVTIVRPPSEEKRTVLVQSASISTCNDTKARGNMSMSTGNRTCLSGESARLFKSDITLI